MADHKDPTDRAHLWDRKARPDEQPESGPAFDYQYALPRHVHKGEASKVVGTPEACEAALDDGWVIHPGDEPRSAKTEGKKKK